VKLTVFGANGPLGQQLVAQAVDRGHEVTAAVRPTEPVSRFSPPVSVVEVDVYANRNIEAALSDATAVCNGLWHTEHSQSDYLSVSGAHILDAMESVGVDRYLTVAPATVRVNDEHCGFAELLVGSVFRLLRPTVTSDAARHIEDVTGRELHWTVLRLLRLTEGRLTRQYRTGNISLGFGSVSYSDCSSFMLDCCERGIYPRMLPKVRT